MIEELKKGISLKLQELCPELVTETSKNIYFDESNELTVFPCVIINIIDRENNKRVRGQSRRINFDMVYLLDTDGEHNNSILNDVSDRLDDDFDNIFYVTEEIVDGVKVVNKHYVNTLDKRAEIQENELHYKFSVNLQYLKNNEKLEKDIIVDEAELKGGN